MVFTPDLDAIARHEHIKICELGIPAKYEMSTKQVCNVNALRWYAHEAFRVLFPGDIDIIVEEKSGTAPEARTGEPVEFSHVVHVYENPNLDDQPAN